MKKTRIFVWAAIVVLVVLLVVGIVLQITNEHDVNDTAYEIIGFSVGIIGMIMAVVSMIGNSQQDRDFDRMERNIRDILDANETDLAMSQKILDEIKPARRKRD